MDVSVAGEESFVGDRGWQLTWYYANAMMIFNYMTTKNKIKKMSMSFKSLSVNFAYSFL